MKLDSNNPGIEENTVLNRADLDKTSRLLMDLGARFQNCLLEKLKPVLHHKESSVRKRAVAILFSWGSRETIELVYSDASKYDVPSAEVECSTGILKGCEIFCCSTLFVRITPEDVSEGIEMHPGLPWFIRMKPSGGCYALDTKSKRCTIWEQRPIACRVFNCKTDPKFAHRVHWF